MYEYYRFFHELYCLMIKYLTAGLKRSISTILIFTTFFALFISKSKSEENVDILAGISGKIKVKSGNVSILWEDIEERKYIIPTLAHTLIENSSQIRAGDALTAGPLNPHDILRIRGKEELQRYLIMEVQRVYRSQGVGIHDKHIEVILRQMLRRVQIDECGDTEFIPGQIVDRFDYQNKNGKILAEGGEPATAKSILLGVTRASLLTDSFLASASFQETTRVLTEAAVGGKRDDLRGLKENVIVGRLIPAGTGFSYHLEKAAAEAAFNEVEDTVSAEDAEQALADALNAGE